MRFLTDLEVRFICTVHNCELEPSTLFEDALPAFSQFGSDKLWQFDLTSLFCPVAAREDEKVDYAVDATLEGDRCKTEVVWVNGLIREEKDNGTPGGR